MKNSQKGSAATVVIGIIALVAIVVAVYFYEKNMQVMNTAQPVTTTTPVTSTTTSTPPPASGSVTWKTYSNAADGFTFMYPSTWTLTESASEKSATVQSAATADIGGGNKIPVESISFTAVDKTFFTPAIGTKYGEIAYDNKLMTLVDQSSTPARCLSAAPLLRSNAGISSIEYGGSMMSDPAHFESAILTKSGLIIAVEQHNEPSTDENQNTLLDSQVKQIGSSFTLLNGNTVTVAACSQQVN